MAFLRELLLLTSLLLSMDMLAAENSQSAGPMSYNTHGHVVAEMSVSCTDVQMTVRFNGTEMNARTTDDTHRPMKVNFFGYDDTNQCNATKDDFLTNTQILQLAVNMSECGINVYEEGDYIVYNQTLVVTYGENPNSMIIREEYDLYNVKCYLNKTANGNFGNLNTIIRETGLEAKNSSAEFAYEFTHSQMNGEVTQSPYTVGQKILFKVKLVNDLGMVKSVVQRCWTASENSNNEYKLIDNRCVSDTAGTEWYGNYTESTTMFSTVAFKYAGASSSMLHLECLVRVCPVGAVDISGVCGKCRDHPEKRRRRRDTDDYSDSDSNLKLIRSPVFYIVDLEDTPTSDKKQESESFMAGTNGTIILVLLAMLVFVAIVAIIKKSFFSSATVQFPTLAVKGIDNKGLA